MVVKLAKDSGYRFNFFAASNGRLLFHQFGACSRKKFLRKKVEIQRLFKHKKVHIRQVQVEITFPSDYIRGIVYRFADKFHEVEPVINP